MRKNVLKGLSLILGVLFLYGCAATKDIEMRPYVEVRDRADQNMEEGNAGFIAGTPQPEDRSEIRKTRKIYVLEVSKGDVDETGETVLIEGNDAVNDIDMEEVDSEDGNYGYTSTSDLEIMDLTGSDTDDDLDTTVGSDKVAATVEYTVQKDDTLQKISKKFYDSFSKWPRIYEVNKDVIDDPDRIKPGIVIQIPAL